MKLWEVHAAVMALRRCSREHGKERCVDGDPRTNLENHVSILELVVGLLLLSPNIAAQTPSWETKPRTADQNFWLWTSVAVGLTVADIELTHHCIHKGACREANPLIPPTSRAKLYGLQFGITAANSYLAYRLKRKGRKRWWLGRIKRTPFILEVRDLWPDTITASGIGREDSILIRSIRALAGFLY